MFALIRLIPIGLIILFFSCNSSNTESSESIQTEALPEVNRSDYRAVKLSDMTVMCHKKLSSDPTSGDQIFAASYLPLEYHIEIRRIPSSRFRREESFPEKKQEQLEWFASQQGKSFENRMNSSQSFSMERCTVNGANCVKQTIEGKEFGFPFEKTYFLRYYRFKSQFYAVTCWTITKNASAFKSIAQYMGMTLETAAD